MSSSRAGLATAMAVEPNVSCREAELHDNMVVLIQGIARKLVLTAPRRVRT
jgi:hypothetical protein